MRRTYAILMTLILVSLTQLSAQDENSVKEHVVKTFREVDTQPFKIGEKLKYRVHYGIVDAGEAQLEVQSSRKIGSRSVYHIVGSGKSQGAFDWFFKVRDRYETYMDSLALFPWVFVRRVDEGGYKLEQDYIFNQFKNKVKSQQKQAEYEVPDNVQDILSAFYFARALDFSDAKPGTEYEIPTFIDEELWPFRIKYVGSEELKTKLGTFRVLKFNPVIQIGRVFKAEEDLTIWITDDPNHIPVRLQAEVLVGSIKMDIKSINGNAYPLALVKED
ncbi:MAG: DUF3108 domain-containing protein [Flavobacteriales bacterium]|nr:DUF3108 domain-containing protein [Flavobacteriales bacterium]MCB9449690.1 DUF3108 domain-containing protein [Flavobacteriales bacterium]